MKKLIVTAMLVALPATFYFVDYKCMQDCQQQGYMYQYCLKICSY